jgi:4-hydroxybenzoate polyprenyltransferase
VGRVGGEPVKGRAYAELLLKSNEMRIVRIAKQLISLSRVSGWWPKVNTVLVAVLLLLVLNPVAIDSFALIPMLALYIVFMGSYGYALNFYSDRQQDIRAEKHQELYHFSKHKLLAIICFFAIGAITVTLLFSDIRVTILGLITFLLTTFYSVKPLRLKERGIIGIIVPALAQRPLPFLIFVLLLGSNSVLSWYLLGWLTMFGLTMMFAHQLLDYRKDRKAQVDTWAQRVGFYWAKRTTTCFLLLMIVYTLLPILLFSINEGLAIAVVILASSKPAITNNLRSLQRNEEAAE